MLLKELGEFMSKDEFGEKMRLEAILDYDMDLLEGKAYKLCLMWMETSQRIFPEYSHSGMKSGDPRKSLLFKTCYKLVRETQGIIEDCDYNLYIRAQLEVLKHISKTVNSNLLISPNCLTGEKAWKRWKLWKRKYDSLTKKTEDFSISSVGIAKALDGINKTQEFYLKSFSLLPTLEQFTVKYSKKQILTLINLGKISPYYLCISPFIKVLLSEKELAEINFDFNAYKHCINEEVLLKFKEMFPNEYL